MPLNYVITCHNYGLKSREIPCLLFKLLQRSAKVQSRGHRHLLSLCVRGVYILQRTKHRTDLRYFDGFSDFSDAVCFEKPKWRSSFLGEFFFFGDVLTTTSPSNIYIYIYNIYIYINSFFHVMLVNCHDFARSCFCNPFVCLGTTDT